MEPRNRFRRTDSASLRSLTGRYDKEGCRTGTPDWESIPGFLKRSTYTSSGVVMYHHNNWASSRRHFYADVVSAWSRPRWIPGSSWRQMVPHYWTGDNIRDFPSYFYSFYLLAVLRIRIRDPVPFWLRDPGWIKCQDPGSGMINPDHISWSLETIRNIPDPQHCFLVQIFQIINW